MSVEITATTFGRFCAAQGPAKYTVVKDARTKYLGIAGYKQGPDYWKAFRDAFTRGLRNADGRAELQALLQSGHVVPERYEHYERAARGAASWIGRKSIQTRPCPTKMWSSGGLRVKVRPEFLATITGTLYVVKLWLNVKEPLTKPRADVMLHLLDVTHGKAAKATPMILDVVRGKDFTPTRVVPGIDTLLHGEAAMFITIWNELSTEAA